MALIEFAHSIGQEIAVTSLDNPIRMYSPLEIQDTVRGSTLIVLPTRTVSIADLESLPDRKSFPLGMTRPVKEYDDVGLIAKSPERIFTRSQKKLTEGDFWWGGPRSTETAVNLSGVTLVEEQAVWEAIFLIELNKLGVLAELPQALVKDANGHFTLITKKIDEVDFLQRDEHEYRKNIEKAKRVGLVPNDISLYNCLSDRGGQNWVIDVNRWSWPPYTDASRQALLQLVTERAAEIDGWK